MRKLLAPAIRVPIVLVFFAACAFVNGVLLADEQTAAFVLIVMFLIMGYFVSVFLHEGGHAMTAQLAKFKLFEILAGPVRIVRNSTNRFELKPNMNPNSPPGMVFAVPETFENLRQRLMLVIVGGPGASLLACLLFGTTSILFFKQNIVRVVGIRLSNFDGWWLGALLGAIAIASLILFIYNVVPRQTRLMESDGYKLRKLLKSGQQANREIQLFIVDQSIIRLRRPQQFPEEALRQALAVRDNSREEGMAHYFAYLKELDSKHNEAADEHLDRLKILYKKMVYRLQPDIAYWIAFHEAFYHRNERDARIWLDEGNRKQPAQTIMKCIANTTVLFLEGRHKAAIEYANQFALKWKQHQVLKTDVGLFYKEIMEMVTKRYIGVIKPILEQERN